MQYSLHILRVFLLPCKNSMQSACYVLCYYVFRIWLYHNFPHCLKNNTIFRKEYIEKFNPVYFVYILVRKTLCFYEEFSNVSPWIYVCIQLTYSLFLSHYSKAWIFPTVFGKVPEYQKIKNPSFVGLVVLCAWEDGRSDGRTNKCTDSHWKSSSHFFINGRII